MSSATMQADDQASSDLHAAKGALAHAHANALRLALYQATGDPELATMETIRIPFWSGAFHMAYLSTEDAAIVQRKALDFLRRQAPSPDRDSATPSDEALREMMGLYAGAPVEDFIAELGREEMSLDEFPRGVEWQDEPSDEVKQLYHVVVIGAGVGGLAAGVQLQRLGIPFTIVDRNAGIGGTWFVNDYPDARVDVASQHYQLSFIKNYPWKSNFATAAEMREYLGEVAGRFDLMPSIRLNTSLVSADWEEATSRWKIMLAGENGVEEVYASAIVSAAGLFNMANKPDIAGIDDFRGRMFHSTEWDHGFDYAGKQVGIVGTGSTGAQLMPRVAKDAAQVTVFQRSPQWVIKVDGYRDSVPAETQWLFDHFPNYWNWFCFGVFHTMFADIEGLQVMDDEWVSGGGLFSRKNDALRHALAEQIREFAAAVPGLADKLTPSFPPFAKRPVIDNGWFDALRRDNVELVTDPIDHVSADGVVLADGREIPIDLLVLCAGFRTEEYLWPVRYTGRHGITLEEAWSTAGAQAYLGVTMPDFPNLFIVYGPNAQGRAGGLITQIELWVRYSIKLLVTMIEQGKHRVEVRRDVFDAYNERTSTALEKCVWGTPGQKSYYLNRHGKNSTNMPWHPRDYFQWIKEPAITDFELG